MLRTVNYIIVASQTINPHQPAVKPVYLVVILKHLDDTFHRYRCVAPGCNSGKLFRKNFAI